MASSLKRVEKVSFGKVNPETDPALRRAFKSVSGDWKIRYLPSTTEAEKLAAAFKNRSIAQEHLTRLPDEARARIRNFCVKHKVNESVIRSYGL
jgi:hypothetical protein